MMALKRWGTLALVTLLASTGTVQAQSASSANTFLTDLYGRYTDGRRSPDSLGGRSSSVFEGNLLTLIRRDGDMAVEASYLDRDPLCTCQNLEVSDVRTRVRLDGPTAAIGEASFVLLGHETVVGLDLVWTPAGWRIHDVHSLVQESLLAYMERSLPPLPDPKPLTPQRKRQKTRSG